MHKICNLLEQTYIKQCIKKPIIHMRSYTVYSLMDGNFMSYFPFFALFFFSSFLHFKKIFSAFSFSLLAFLFRNLQVSQLFSTDKWNWIRSIDRRVSSGYVYTLIVFTKRKRHGQLISCASQNAWIDIGNIVEWPSSAEHVLS